MMENSTTEKYGSDSKSVSFLFKSMLGKCCEKKDISTQACFENKT